MSLPKPDLQTTFFDARYLDGELFEPADRYEIFRRRILAALRAMCQGLCDTVVDMGLRSEGGRCL